MLKNKGIDIKGKTVAVSGFGNVAWGAVTKATELGAKVVTISGPDGYVYDPDGISGDKIDYMLELRASGNDIVAPYAEKYPNAKIMEIDVEDDRNDWDFGYTEVDIIHNGISKDVLFDQTGDWHSTSWEVRQNELPEAVKNTINNQYGEYRFDEAKRIEKADGTIYYRIELEKMNVDLEVNINEDGIVIP